MAYSLKYLQIRLKSKEVTNILKQTRVSPLICQVRVLLQSNLAIRNKLVLRNHFLWPSASLLHKDKEHLALRNNFRVTKKFPIAKFDCTRNFHVTLGCWSYFQILYARPGKTSKHKHIVHVFLLFDKGIPWYFYIFFVPSFSSLCLRGQKTNFLIHSMYLKINYCYMLRFQSTILLT